ncbi:MAG TPA: hypothetical protein VMG34_08380 [Bacteroidota bacterium]|nr:hypothetical protein [Bacteroidota bacterium]
MDESGTIAIFQDHLHLRADSSFERPRGERTYAIIAAKFIPNTDHEQAGH